jgi:hypothetical protein
MKSNINIIPLRTWLQIPRSWESRPNQMNYHKLPLEEHIQDGWREYIRPTLSENQILGELFFDDENDVVTNRVINLTSDEILARDTQRILSEAEMRKEDIIQQKLKDDALNYFQALPAEDALQNKEVYPMWSQKLEFVEAPHKYLQVIDAELVLWEVVQSHVPKDYPFEPSELQALWKRVALPDQILPWSQPLGGHDAYQIGDEVIHKEQNWVSTHANNVWEPGVFGWELK